MAFTVPTRDQVRDRMLRDLGSLEPGADVSADSDWYVRASAHAGAAEGLYAHQLWIARQILPDTCDDDTLLRHAQGYGIARKAASAATGQVTLAGTQGVTFAAGLELRSATGVAYATTAAATVPSAGTVSVDVLASVAGVNGNLAAGTTLTVSSPPAGGSASAVSGGLTGGADVESIDALRARVQDVRRNPPAGGALHDYKRWALDVPGVAAGYVHPLRRGDGTVDLTIMAVGGLPSSTLVAAVQAHIDDVRPVTANCQVLAPAALTVNVAGSLVVALGYVSATVLAAVRAALATYFASLEPGQRVYVTRLVSIVADVPGVQDFALASPTANVTPVINAATVQIAALGSVIWTA
jgi:uncharacterized phage protein gp47/JayE